MTFFKQTETEEQIQTIFQRIAQLQEELNKVMVQNESLKFQIEHSSVIVKDNNGLMGRVEDLEIWRAKVHSMMIMTNPVSKKERLSPIGKKWADKYQA